MPLSTSAADATHSSVGGAPGPVTAALATPRTRRRFWVLLGVTLAVCTLFYPPPWQALLRGVLVKLAARRGGELTIGRMQGGPFDTIHLYNVRWRQQDPRADTPGNGTDLRVAHAELTFAWRWPSVRKSPSSDVRDMMLDGVSGRWDLRTISGGSAVQVPSRSGRWLDRISARLVPARFFVRADDLSLQRDRYHFRARGLRLSGERDAVGVVLARELEIAGPGFENTLLNRHGQTLSRGSRWTLSGLDLGPGVRLLNATLDGSHLKSQRLEWECALTAMGGEIRGQGAINFVQPRLALEVAGSMRRLPVAPLARLLGLAGPAGGQVSQGNFSFRGEPDNWTAAEMWLTAQATDFRWGQRDWQTLDLRATVLHQRIQVHRLELKQSLNRVSLAGECPLSAPGHGSGRWWEAGFSCNVDARLDDLHALAQLFGHRWPEMSGRMSVNGTLEAMPGRPGIGGYLNVEGSRLSIRGAPLDYLRSTILFRGDELNVADVQATRGEDYFTGHGTVTLVGDFGYQGELRLAMGRPDLYAPALAGLVDLEKVGLPADGPRAPVHLEGVFYGPDAGKTVLLTFGGLDDPSVLPSSMGGDWPGLTQWPAGAFPAATFWQF